MKKRVSGTVAFLFAAGAVVMLSAKGNSTVIDALTFINTRVDTVDGVFFTAGTDKKNYRSGDSLRVRYRINNHSMGTVLYNFSTSCQFELQVVGSNGNTVYSLPAHGMASGRCEPEATRLMIAPSAEKRMEFTPVLLKLKSTDTLTVKAQMAGYPLSAVPVRIIYQATSTPAVPFALEGTVGNKPVLEFNSETKMLVITVTRAQRLTISAFILTGQKINKLSCEKFLAPGTHLISFNNRKLSDGVVIFKVEGNGFSETKTINLSR
jgi:hypothetical protein